MEKAQQTQTIDSGALKLAERLDQIQEIIRAAYKTNNLDLVDDMIDELKAIEERIKYQGYLC